MQKHKVDNHGRRTENGYSSIPLPVDVMDRMDEARQQLQGDIQKECPGAKLSWGAFVGKLLDVYESKDSAVSAR